MPDCVASMDGCSIRMNRPAAQGEGYYSGYKKGYGLNLFAVVDYNCKFLEVVIGNPARVGDGSYPGRDCDA